ncbi:exodeoxyribonuclease VII small subunit [Isosphaeraceae bacterium EP7]
MESGPKFEEALERIGVIVASLERGDGDLGRSLGEYEEGIRLLARCKTILDGAERSVTLLTGVDDEGNPEGTPFEPHSSTETK